jgi:cytochrome c-type biogenesis protein CcmE
VDDLTRDVAEDGLDLTPFAAVPPAGRARPRSRARRWLPLAVLLVVIAAGAALLLQMGSASLYFRNADEAVAERDELGARRFRLQGTVVAGTVERTGDRVAFAVEHGGTQVDVLHAGDPPQLFQEGIPVVVEGRFDGEAFASDRIMVRHTEEYAEDNPDRLPEGTP